MGDEELRSLFVGYGYEPLFVEGDEPRPMHPLMAGALDTAFDSNRAIQSNGARRPAEQPSDRTGR